MTPEERVSRRKFLVAFAGWLCLISAILLFPTQFEYGVALAIAAAFLLALKDTTILAESAMG
jgi:hypothetical protein